MNHCFPSPVDWFLSSDLATSVYIVEAEAANSTEKEDIARQNKALEKELENVKAQAAAAVQKANEEAQKQVEDARASLLRRERELGARISSQIKELLG